MNVYTEQEILIDSKKLTLGFLGVGWIGRHRMKCIYDNLKCNVLVADVNKDVSAVSLDGIEEGKVLEDLENLIASKPDGIIIATPSALHARQSVYALKNKIAVFCQKPLGRSYSEAKQVVEVAKLNNKLLGVDFSYRHTQAVEEIKKVLDAGEIGEIYGAELIFHNAYGPDKDWFYNPELSGGGCVIDLGSHLIDLIMWLTRSKEIKNLKSNLFSNGKKIIDLTKEVEDYAEVSFELENDAIVRMACSWNLPAGRDAVIEMKIFGTKGGVGFKNINGSFYDFTAEFYRKTATTTLSSPPDDWGGRVAVEWANKLITSDNYNPEAEEFLLTSKIIDEIYGR